MDGWEDLFYRRIWRREMVYDQYICTSVVGYYKFVNKTKFWNYKLYENKTSFLSAQLLLFN